MRFGRFLSCALLILPGIAAAAPVAVAPFKSVEARNGAHVTVRYGQSQRVDVLSGSPKISVDGDGRLRVDNRGHSREARTNVEIVTPRIDALSVAEGGRLTVEGGFPRHAIVAVAVHNGGRLDLRRLPVDQVSAAVNQGGMIAVRPARQLLAAVSQGGNITYWGQPAVTPSINQGGVITRGEPGDLDKPL